MLGWMWLVLYICPLIWKCITAVHPVLDTRKLAGYVQVQRRQLCSSFIYLSIDVSWLSQRVPAPAPCFLSPFSPQDNLPLVFFTINIHELPFHFLCIVISYEYCIRDLCTGFRFKQGIRQYKLYFCVNK